MNKVDVIGLANQINQELAESFQPQIDKLLEGGQQLDMHFIVKRLVPAIIEYNANFSAQLLDSVLEKLEGRL